MSRLALLGLSALLCGCAGLDQSAGGSSYETENALTARISGSTLPGDTVVSLTQGRQTVADARGMFLLDSLRLGLHALYGRVSKGRAYVDVTGNILVASGPLRPEAAGEVLLEDFEDGDSRHRYGAWTGNGWWWIAGDSTVSLSPAGIAATPAQAILLDSTGNRRLRFTASFSGNSVTEWAETGIRLDSAPVDLSALTSVRFQAKGSGTLTVRLVGAGTTAGQNLEATASLTPQWQTVEIPVAAFQLPAWSGDAVDSTGRIAKLRRSTGLAWSLGTNGELWLDDVVLIGPSASSLWPGLPKP